MKLTYITLGLIIICSKLVSQDYCKFISDVEDYQKSVRLYNNFNSIDSSTFSVDAYLSIFDKLKRKDSLEYCYTYHNIRVEGTPVLYAKDNSYNVEAYIATKMIEAEEDINERVNNFRYSEDSLKAKEQKRESRQRLVEGYKTGYAMEYRKSVDYGMKYHLIPEDSPLGYFQYLYFSEMGESFAGYWHSIERCVICSYEEFEEIKDDYENISSEVNLEPILNMTENYCKISWFEYVENWGIFKRTYKVNRAEPYKIKRTKEKLFASEIDDGIIL